MSNSDEQPVKKAIDVDKILASEEINEIYANGYNIAAGTADVVIILQRNGKNIQTLNISFTLAKSMALGLSEVVQAIEKKTGMNIKTTKDIELSLEATKDDN